MILDTVHSVTCLMAGFLNKFTQTANGRYLHSLPVYEKFLTTSIKKPTFLTFLLIVSFIFSLFFSFAICQHEEGSVEMFTHMVRWVYGNFALTSNFPLDGQCISSSSPILSLHCRETSLVISMGINYPRIPQFLLWGGGGLVLYWPLSSSS